MNRTIELDKHGYSRLGRNSITAFCEGRNDVRMYRVGGVLVVYTSDCDEDDPYAVGVMDIVTGYWRWISMKEARELRRSRA